MYTTESCTTSIAVSDYKKRYIDIPTFTEYCKACPNYDRLWSCPPYTFDVEAFWNQFQTLDLFAVKIIYNDNYAGKQFSEHKIADIMRQSLSQCMGIDLEWMEEGRLPHYFVLVSGLLRR